MRTIKIAPSILSADKKILGDEVKQIEKHCELIHVDIMDGKFVPPRTFDALDIKKIKTKIPKDVHLMVMHPLAGGYIDDYLDAGAYIIVIHVEAKDEVSSCIDYIKKRGVRVGLAINPPTPVQAIRPYLDRIDMALVMSVNPGYAGQKFMPEVLSKVRELRSLKPCLDIQIDGGISKETIRQAFHAGANVFVAGSAIFGQRDRIAAIKELRDAAGQD